MRKSLRKILFLPAIIFLLLIACEPQKTPDYPREVLTQKARQQGKMPITILVKYAFSINTFEQAVEKKFPDVDIIQVGNYTKDSGIAEYEARMEHDDLTDIVMTWPIETGEEYCEERLLDLSAMSITGKYNTSSLNQISKDGKLYYLPGPAQIRGIVYNKTLFAENGWFVPKDFDGFIELCQTIEKTGLRSLQLGLGNPEVLDTAFVGYSYADCYSKPKDTKWISDYNAGNGSFGDHFAPALNTFETLIDTGVLKPEDLDITYADRENMLFNRKCAMVEDSVLLSRMGGDITGTTDEFALMPFFNPGADGDWARLYPVCYIGINKHLADPENKEKYDLVMQIMNYISTPEGQLTLAGDTGGMYSNLKGMPPPDVVEIEPLLPALEHARYAIFPTLHNAQGALRTGLAGMLNGTMTSDDVIKMVDTQNISPPKSPEPTVIGTAKSDFTIMDTGNFLTDAMAKKSECEIALFLDNGKDGLYSGKGLCSKIYKGDITTQDIFRLMPDTKYGEKSTLQKLTMTGADLLNALEYSVQVGSSGDGWFYYFSGLKMEYAPAAEPGSRIRKITTTDGSEISPDKIYSVATMDGSVDEKYIKSSEITDIKISTILSDAIKNAKSISPSIDGRFIHCAP